MSVSVHLGTSVDAALAVMEWCKAGSNAAKGILQWPSVRRIGGASQRRFHIIAAVVSWCMA
jgi:hypothetical protein